MMDKCSCSNKATFGMGGTLLHEKNLLHGNKVIDTTMAPDMHHTKKEFIVEKGFAT